MKTKIFTNARRLMLTVIAILTVGVIQMMAAEVTIAGSDSWANTGSSGSGGAISITKNNISVSSSKGYVNGSSVKIYGTNTFTISSSQNNMTEIEFTSSGTYDIKNHFSANVGSVNGSQRKWTGDASSVTFTVTQTSDWTSVKVTTSGYSLYFSSNGAITGTVPAARENSTYSWSEQIPYHAGVNDLRNADGCRFLCWNTDKNGNGTDYVAGQTFNGTGNQTLYVKWGDCHYDVTYNLTGVTKTSGPTSIESSSTSDLEASFDVDNGYTTPVAATITMGGYNWTSNASFTYEFDETEGLLEFGPGYFDGDIVITITATEKPCTPISPTLTYASAAMTVGQSTAAPTVTGNTGGGTVTYSITSGGSHATINSGTGVVTASSAGNITVTASIAEKTSGGTTYCANTATYNITIAAVTRTVTWHINGVTSTTQVADGTKPTAPTVDVSDYCGDKFIGWTRCQISGSVGSESSVSAGGCGLIKTASGFPNVTSDGVEYYAVFADENP